MMSVCIAVNSGGVGTAPVLLNALAIWLTLLPSLPSSPNSRASSTRSTLRAFHGTCPRAAQAPRCANSRRCFKTGRAAALVSILPHCFNRHPHGNAVSTLIVS